MLPSPRKKKLTPIHETVLTHHRYISLACISIIDVVIYYHNTNYQIRASVIVFFAISITVTFIFFNRILYEKLICLFSPRSNLLAILKNKLEKLFISIHEYKKHKMLLAITILLAFLLNILRIVMNYINSQAMELNIPFSYFFIFIPLIILIMMMPILEGIGTKEKMSKSLGNYVGITEEPEDIFGKIMNITDGQIDEYYRLCTQLKKEEIEKIKENLNGRPKKLKERLAFEIVKLYHNEEAAKKANEIFEIKHGKTGRRLKKGLGESESVKEKLAEIAEHRQIAKDELKENKIWICKLLKLIKATSSNSEARRFIEQKAVKIDGNIIENVNKEVPYKEDGYILQVGKRKIYYIRFK